MITDQVQSGVPNGNAFKTQGIDQRTQLVKPTQVSNLGRSGAPQFNPIQPNGGTPSAQSNMRVEAVEPASNLDLTPKATSTQMAAANSTASPQMADLTPRAASTQMPAQSQTQMDQARAAIRQMSDNDIITLLDEIANGSLRGTNI